MTIAAEVDSHTPSRAARPRGKASSSIHPIAPRAFHADRRPSDQQTAADDAWKRCLAWLKTHGVA